MLGAWPLCRLSARRAGFLEKASEKAKSKEPGCFDVKRLVRGALHPNLGTTTGGDRRGCDIHCCAPVVDDDFDGDVGLGEHPPPSLGRKVLLDSGARFEEEAVVDDREYLGIGRYMEDNLHEVDVSEPVERNVDVYIDEVAVDDDSRVTSAPNDTGISFGRTGTDHRGRNNRQEQECEQQTSDCRLSVH